MSRGYVWISQGQKRGWKVGSGALLRKDLLKGCWQRSCLPPGDERKKKKYHQFKSGHKDLRNCLNSVNSSLSRWWINQTSPSPAPASTDTQMCACHLSGLQTAPCSSRCSEFQEKIPQVGIHYYCTYNAGFSLLLLFVTHPFSFCRQLKNDWQWIYLR